MKGKMHFRFGRRQLPANRGYFFRSFVADDSQILCQLNRNCQFNNDSHRVYKMALNGGKRKPLNNMKDDDWGKNT